MRSYPRIQTSSSSSIHYHCCLSVALAYWEATTPHILVEPHMVLSPAILHLMVGQVPQCGWGIRGHIICYTICPTQVTRGSCLCLIHHHSTNAKWHKICHTPSGFYVEPSVHMALPFAMVPEWYSNCHTSHTMLIPSTVFKILVQTW